MKINAVSGFDVENHIAMLIITKITTYLRLHEEG